MEVILGHAPQAYPRPPGFVRHAVRASDGRVHRVWMNPTHGLWMNALRERCEPVWPSGREHDAIRLLGPDFGLLAMPVIEFTQRPELAIALRKPPDVNAFNGDTPTAWVDDDLDSEAEQWRTIAKRRPCCSSWLAPSG